MVIRMQLPHAKTSQRTGTDLHGDLHAARAHVPLDEGRRMVQPPCERLPHARWQLVRRAVEQLKRQAVHHIHGMVQVQGSLQGPLRRRGCLLREPCSRLLLALAGSQAPHLLLQAILLLLLLQQVPLQQLLLKLLLKGGACSLPRGRHRSHDQLRLEALLLVGGPESLSHRFTNRRRQLVLGGSCSLAWLILREGLGGACRSCKFPSLHR